MICETNKNIELVGNDNFHDIEIYRYLIGSDNRVQEIKTTNEQKLPTFSKIMYYE